MRGTSIITPKGISLEKVRGEAIQAAKEIGYDETVVEKLRHALGQNEINNILIDARHKWDVDPGRWYEDR